jgi:hypothetical protein
MPLRFLITKLLHGWMQGRAGSYPAPAVIVA